MTRQYDRSDSFGFLKPTQDPSGENLSPAEENLLHPTAPLYKIVLTGGPCGGKTTAMARLSSFFQERGFQVMTCPEAYGTLVTNGMNAGDFFSVPGMGFMIQHSVMDLMISVEDSFERVLRSRGLPAVLLCDRGIMDGRAYLSEEEWDQILRSRGIKSSVNLREGRYNAVFHLVTAAEGADAFYTLENNAVRTETPAEARVVDAKTRSAWLGHPTLHVFDNENTRDFEDKMRRLVDTAAKLVGLPSELNREPTKFLLKKIPKLTDFPPEVSYHVFDVEKVYLYEERKTSIPQDTTNSATFYGRSSSTSLIDSSQFEQEYSFVRKRAAQNNPAGAVYGQTTVQKTLDGQEIELKRIITQREYNAALKIRDTTRHIIKQTRIAFLWKMQSFNVHIYHKPTKAEGLCILHCQLISTANDSEVHLPPFFQVERKLTAADKKYGARMMSMKDTVTQ